jgi:hypothetical protein
MIKYYIIASFCVVFSVVFVSGKVVMAEINTVLIGEIKDG